MLTWKGNASCLDIYEWPLLQLQPNQTPWEMIKKKSPFKFVCDDISAKSGVRLAHRLTSTTKAKECRLQAEAAGRPPGS